MKNIKLSKKQKLLFIENIWSLLGSWIPIIQALDILLLQSQNKNINNLCIYTKNQINNWESLFQIFSKLKKVFNVFDITMLEIWEQTWQVWKSFDLITQKEEKEMDLKNKIKQVLIYPISIIIVTILMLVVIMIYVLPKIELIYRESNINLPYITQKIIDISHFFINYWIFVLISFFLIIFLLMFIYKKNSSFSYFFDKNIFKIPIFWHILKTKVLINFTDFLSTLLSSWIIINKAISITQNWINNYYYKKEIYNILEEIKNWNPFSSAILWNKNNLDKLNIKKLAFPIELVTSIKIWEQTWTLSKMLQKISIKYTKELDNKIKNLSAAIEPVIILVIWWVVWVIIMAILLPFLNMANVIK